MINDIKIIKAAAAAVAGTGTVTGSIIDTAGFEGVMFLTNIEIADAGTYIKAQDGANSGLSDAADLAGSGTQAETSGDTVALDIKRPAKRYIRPVITRGVSSATGAIYALLYKSTKVPKNNGQIEALTGYSAKELLSPIAGTA